MIGMRRLKNFIASLSYTSNMDSWTPFLHLYMVCLCDTCLMCCTVPEPKPQQKDLRTLIISVSVHYGFRKTKIYFDAMWYKPARTKPTPKRAQLQGTDINTLRCFRAEDNREFMIIMIMIMITSMLLHLVGRGNLLCIPCFNSLSIYMPARKPNLCCNMLACKSTWFNAYLE